MMPTSNNSYSLVYSTGHGRTCPECSLPITQCKGHTKQILPKSDGIVRVSLDTKGRKGKGVTVMSGIPFIEDDLQKLAKKLKTLCGAGGTVKDGVVEIQGDHRDKVINELSKSGYKVKRSGG